MSATSRPEVIELIADCFHHHDTTEFLHDINMWRHENGQFVTGDEAETIRKATMREVLAAHNVVVAEHKAIFGDQYQEG
jgi:hypothetical protein